MSISSYPFDGQAVSEGQYSYLFRELSSHSGIADSVGGTGFNVYGDSSGMQVKVNAGFAVVRGHAVQSTATETVTIAAASAAQRYDRVVLRLDPTANSITLAVVQGSSGGSVPALTQTDTGVYELPLAVVTVPVGAATISAGNVVSERRFLGNTVGGWTTTTRPESPRVGRLGLNTSTNSWEFWDGTQWKDLAPTINWATIEGRPGSFAPTAHTHLWADITDKPLTFPSSPHGHDWDDITGKPTTFAPSTHSHAWSTITSKPATFPPSSHDHSQFVTSSETIAWANGTKRVHNDSVSGSGTYYAVWVQGDGTFARNTSSIKFKENVRDYEVNVDAVLSLNPRIYDRKDVFSDKGDLREGQKDEVGLIAEEVAALGLTWMVNYLDGEIDGLRYDLLGVALIPVVQRQAQQISALEGRLAALEAAQS
ncbi:tail fiber domain-containing protein [Streptomyces sp. ID05-39B]|uniref:tail fiber domain-containing protein n=1 Tax=Streptomyces sp. ID05-39B TaxID=3028664 RepID=UPI0029AD0834|nr:tail fiber domain-containing protein [Streptomyces sp. ID05-39B]MDX3525067.1 tail fiber domain-containing protein [Streptomyces sp. ID05-39B]